MKKIGIITLNGEYNYGNRLQTYALQQAISRLGATADTVVEHAFVTDMKGMIKRVIGRLPLIHPRLAYWRMMAEKEKVFTPFSRKKISTRLVQGGLSSIQSDYDLFIVGSDQVWNPHYIGTSTTNFLTFTPKEKRVSYAASFGVSEIPGEQQEVYKKNLPEMHSISVREQVGVQLVKQLAGRDALLVPDPTMLLDKEDWSRLVSTVDTSSWGKYVIIYTLRGLDKDAEGHVRGFAESKGCTIYEVMGDQYSDHLEIPDPAEFIARIANAQAVFTDSFHASVFSIIMHTPFKVFERKDMKMSSRLQTLALTYRMQDSLNTTAIEEAEFDFVQSDSILASRRKIGMEYLSRIINQKEVK